MKQSLVDSQQDSIADEHTIRVGTSHPATKIGGILSRADWPVSTSDHGVAWSPPGEGVRAEPRTIPWWLWWNVLSIDAPTVALVWGALFAHASGGRLSGAEATVLVLTVWMIYVSDRLLDGWTERDRAALQERHHFSERHRFVLAGLVLFACSAIAWLTTDRLRAAEVTAGVKLGVIVVVYMTSIHTGRGWIAGMLPKEIAAGFLFASGATLPVWSRAERLPWDAWLPWVLFGLLCSLNCLAIECWENHHHSKQWRRSPRPFVRWADSRISRSVAALAVAAWTACLVCNPRGPSVSVLSAVGLGALLLLVLNARRAKLSPTALRVLADAALLVPAILALGLGG
jgi:hypothetical protein